MSKAREQALATLKNDLKLACETAVLNGLTVPDVCFQLDYFKTGYMNTLLAEGTDHAPLQLRQPDDGRD
ncbi:MAG: hypothetical protein ABL309_13835 [Phycisphaerales bacterium]